SDQDHAGLAGGAGIAFRGVGRARFMTHQDMADAVIREQFAVDRQDRAAGIAEHEFDTLPDQAFDQYRSAAAFFGHVSIPSSKTNPARWLAPGRLICFDGPPSMRHEMSCQLEM